MCTPRPLHTSPRLRRPDLTLRHFFSPRAVAFCHILSCTAGAIKHDWNNILDEVKQKHKHTKVFSFGVVSFSPAVLTNQSTRLYQSSGSARPRSGLTMRTLPSSFSGSSSSDSPCGHGSDATKWEGKRRGGRGWLVPQQQRSHCILHTPHTKLHRQVKRHIEETGGTGGVGDAGSKAVRGDGRRPATTCRVQRHQVYPLHPPESQHLFFYSAYL